MAVTEAIRAHLLPDGGPTALFWVGTALLLLYVPLGLWVTRFFIERLPEIKTKRRGKGATEGEGSGKAGPSKAWMGTIAIFNLVSLYVHTSGYYLWAWYVGRNVYAESSEDIFGEQDPNAWLPLRLAASACHLLLYLASSTWMAYLMLVFNDLMYYLYHRAVHRWRCLSWLHRMHHEISEPNDNFYHAYYIHPMESIISVQIGFTPLMVVPRIGMGALLIYGLLAPNVGQLNHVGRWMRFPWFFSDSPQVSGVGGALKAWRPLSTSPDHHVHHYFPDKNFGEYSNLFDLVFGTYRPPISAFGRTDDPLLVRLTRYRARGHLGRPLFATRFMDPRRRKKKERVGVSVGPHGHPFLLLLFLLPPSSFAPVPLSRFPSPLPFGYLRLVVEHRQGRRHGADSFYHPNQEQRGRPDGTRRRRRSAWGSSTCRTP